MNQWFCYGCGKRRTEACSRCPGVPAWADNGVLGLREQIEFDTALLRQALEALEDVPYMSNGDDQVVWSEAVYALRKRLGEEEE